VTSRQGHLKGNPHGTPVCNDWASSCQKQPTSYIVPDMSDVKPRQEGNADVVGFSLCDYTSSRCCPRTANLCTGRHITIAHRLMRCAAQWLARAPRHTPAVKLCAGHWPQHTTMTHRPTHCASLWLHGPHGTQTAAKPCAGHCPLPPPYGTQQQLRFVQGTDLSTLP
jgi:hypothetical protein